MKLAASYKDSNRKTIVHQHKRFTVKQKFWMFQGYVHLPPDETGNSPMVELYFLTAEQCLYAEAATLARDLISETVKEYPNYVDYEWTMCCS